MPLICSKLLLEFTPPKSLTNLVLLSSALQGHVFSPHCVGHHATGVPCLYLSGFSTGKVCYMAQILSFFSSYSMLDLESSPFLESPFLVSLPCHHHSLPSPISISGLLLFLPQVLHTYLIGLVVVNLFLLQPVLDAD